MYKFKYHISHSDIEHLKGTLLERLTPILIRQSDKTKKVLSNSQSFDLCYHLTYLIFKIRNVDFALIYIKVAMM